MIDKRTSYPLRMPDELRQQLEQKAKASDKSLNAEIVARLTLSLSDINKSQAKANAYELAILKERFEKLTKFFSDFTDTVNK